MSNRFHAVFYVIKERFRFLFIVQLRLKVNMFKFGFSRDDTDNEGQENSTEKSILDWIEASEVVISPKSYDKHNFHSTDCKTLPNLNLKLIRTDEVVRQLTENNCKNIIEAETQHSDLVPAKYEGGLKIWECSYDLSSYLLERHLNLSGQKILDLGCGAGVVGLTALLRGATVHFQDYNEEVIRSLTVPNILLNLDETDSILEKCFFYCGDWGSLVTLLSNKFTDDSEKYDFILTSETIYNPTNHSKLYEVFKKLLKKDGVVYVAGKVYYFGVGGGMRQFENLIREDGIFETSIAWKSEQGLQREILKLIKKL